MQAAGEAAGAARAAEAVRALPLSVLEGGALLVVETTPPGAEVLVDGTWVGETPLERSDIGAGVREVTLRHPHYETLRIPDRNFEDGVALRVERVLQRGAGRLTVTAMPRGARVEVDGERLAEGTPVTLENLPAGPVEVRLSAPEHRPLAVEIEIPKDGAGAAGTSAGADTLWVADPGAGAAGGDCDPAGRGAALPVGSAPVGRLPPRGGAKHGLPGGGAQG